MANSLLQRDSRNKFIGKPKARCICRECGSIFYAYQSTKRKYCSKKCAGLNSILPDRTGKHHKLTEETKKKMSLAKKGKPLSKNHIKALSGKNHYRWMGIDEDENRRIRKSLRFRRWREKVFKRDDWTCQNCLVRGGELHPHHIKWFAHYPKLRFVVSNGITLCATCHKKEHAKK